MTSRFDLLDDVDQIWTIKCSNDISLKHTLYSIINTVMYKNDMINDDYTTNDMTDIDPIVLNFINFLKGEEISYEYDLSNDKIKQIIETVNKSES